MVQRSGAAHCARSLRACPGPPALRLARTPACPAGAARAGAQARPDPCQEARAGAPREEALTRSASGARQVYRMDKATHRPTTDPEAIERYKKKLRKVVADQARRL